MPVQVNGKLRGTLEIAPDTDSEIIKEEALAIELSRNIWMARPRKR